MKFKLIFIVYCVLMGLIVGMIAALFLTLVNALIHVVWVVVPGLFHEPVYYPLIIGITGGILVGIFRSKVGNYPKTIHETLHEFQTTRKVTYQKALPKNFVAAILVLTFGASLGPEAALASILGGLISWVGDQMKLTMARKTELLELSIGAMMASIFYAPLVGISEPLEEPLAQRKLMSKGRKVILYAVTTLTGVLGFNLITNLFPKESVFAIHTPIIHWEGEVLWVMGPAILLGIGFGYLFQLFDKYSELIAQKINRPILLAIMAGGLIGGLGMVSPYFLFSGEHELLDFSQEVAHFGLPFILLIAIGKALLTNLCFAFGWRGGKIFPAIFASTAMGFGLANLFSYTPGLIVGIVVAASVTIILEQPYVTGALLLFLFPIQFFPFIIVTCLFAHQFSKKVAHLRR